MELGNIEIEHLRQTAFLPSQQLEYVRFKRCASISAPCCCCSTYSRIFKEPFA